MSTERDLQRVVAGRYRLIEKIGSGGMGSVFLAEQLGVGKKVAVKFLAPQFAADEALAQRFLREGRVSVEVSHPGAAQLIDMGRDRDELYLIFEYVDGENLSARIARNGPLPFNEARDIAVRVAEVLAFAHDHGIVHRDIKPDNIRVKQDLNSVHVKVLDFGIAKWIKSDVNLTAEGSMAGTPRYMAPEQVRGESVDARTDIYALGLILFEMVAGRAAFPSSNVAQLLLHQMQQPVPSLESVNPSLRFPALDALISKACAKNPALRFGHMMQFVAALKAVRTDKASHLVPASGMPHQEVTGDVSAVRRELATFPPTMISSVRKQSRPWLLWGLLAVMGLGAAAMAAGFAIKAAQMTAGHSSGAAGLSALVGPACPGLDMYDTSLTSLSVEDMEKRVSASRLMAPSIAKKQLAMIQASLGNYAPDKRDCMYRSSLIGMLASEATTMKSLPESWGQQYSSDKLRMQILELPMKKNYTLAQRKNLMSQIDSMFIKALTEKEPGDAEYWRRMYFGMFLVCEVTDEARANLKAAMPGTCLSLTPAN